MEDKARRTSLYILNRLDDQLVTLDKLIEKTFSKNDSLLKRDRNFIYALVYGVLRFRGRLDWIIQHFSNIGFDKIDPPVLNVLRLGLYQIIYMSKVPVSAAVNTSVDLAGSVSASWVVRYVNGVLRNAAKNYKNIPFPDVDHDPVKGLATGKSFPPWLIKKWINRFGIKETETLCDSINTIPSITLRANSIKISREKLKKLLDSKADKIELTKYAPDGIMLSEPKALISELPGYYNGYFQVQDEAAQLVSLLLNPQPEESVLDACAGLGGKTGHIAQLMHNNGKLVAMDKDNKKLVQLEIEMDRLGICIATSHVHDLRTTLPKNIFEKFDRILLDAPCSGLGVIRRNPDIKWRSSKQNPEYFAKRQVLFLNNLASFLKPGGIMVYAVCSWEPEENEAVINAFLKKNKEFVIDNNINRSPFNNAPFINGKGYMKTFPHRDNMDGFFSARLKKII